MRIFLYTINTLAKVTNIPSFNTESILPENVAEKYDKQQIIEKIV